MNHRKTTEVRKSSISGNGLFALVPFEEGDIILPYTGRTYPLADPEDLSSWPEEIDGIYSIIVPGGAIDPMKDGLGSGAEYANHSCDGNCELQASCLTDAALVALRDIEPGEEIVYDYAYPYVSSLEEGLKDFPCSCGSSVCLNTRAYLPQEVYDGVISSRNSR